MNDRKEYLKKYRLNNKEKYRQYQAKYRKSHLSTYEKTKEENQKLQQRINLYESVINDIKHILNNQIDYRDSVDIVNAIEEILERVNK